MVSSTEHNPPKKMLKYPKSVFFIISNEFCERFNYYGMRTVLVLYLTRRLAYSDDQATVLFHIFASLVYFFPLAGAIIADSWLGRFKTIFYISIVYATGSLLLSLGAIPTLHLPVSAVTVLGLLLIALGTGGIKPCVSAFGGDQFKLPEQAKELGKFFSIFYLAINVGSLISTTLTPILREDVHCFGEKECYSLAFGVPGALMIISIVVFVCGKPFYKMVEPSGNMLINVGKCIVNAIKTRSRERLTKPRYHWLDYAEKKYGKKLVYDVKCLLKVLVLYIPLPIFWALFDQQGSRWTFQATQMTGYISKFYSIKPDQMQVLNPLIVVFCIPLFNFWIYPALERINIKTELQKLTFGMVLCGVAFVISGFLELKLETTYAVLPKSGEGQLRIFNGQPCNYTIQTNIPDHKEIILEPFSMWEEKHIEVDVANHPSTSVLYNISANSNEENCQTKITNGQFSVQSKQALSYFLNGTGTFLEYEDSPDKPKRSSPMIRILLTSAQIDGSSKSGILPNEIVFKSTGNATHNFVADLHQLHEIPEGTYFIMIKDTRVGAVNLKEGGKYTILINQKNSTDFTMAIHTIAQPNSIHILWQVPQYIVITAGEIMFSVTGLEFSFTQAPSSMKSVLQAFWLLTMAIGNMLVVVITKINIFESQAYEFFLFAVLMGIDICIFIFLAMKYKYRNQNDAEALDQPDAGNSPTNRTFVIAPNTTVNNTRNGNAGGNITLNIDAKPNADDKIDESPKCLKQRPSSKNGQDNYGYTE